MSPSNPGAPGVSTGCPRVTRLLNAASRLQLVQGLVADCVILIGGENLSPQTEQFNPPVHEAFGVFVRLSTGERFPIYSLAPEAIMCVAPGSLTPPAPYTLELAVPQQGPVPCPPVTLKGLTATTAPGLFTQDGSGEGKGLFFTYPDGQAQPLPAGDNFQPTLVQAYGTGLRHAQTPPSALLDGASATITAVEADTTRPGYDRLIFQLPAGLASGLHTFKVIADGRTSNEVTIEVM